MDSKNKKSKLVFENVVFVAMIIKIGLFSVCVSEREDEWLKGRRKV